MVVKEIRENWSFRKKGDEKWLPATVPGCVHTDLLENKLIPDPLFGINARSLQWIEQEEWEYRCTFEGSSYLLDHDQLEIWFYGVDTFAEIQLNGKTILVTNNMFHPWKANVRDLIHEGENTIDVRFASPYKKGLEEFKKLPYSLPSANDKGDFKVSPFVRKPAYQFGWDWAPRLLTSGLWKNIELLAWNKLKIRDFYVLQRAQSPEIASLSCELDLDVHSAGEYIYAVYVDKDLILTGKARLMAGINKLSLPFDICNPRLWYPRGYGRPEIYKITIDIKDNDILLDTRQTTTGIRKVELVSKDSGSDGDFHFRINGMDVFAKGANIVPLDIILPRVKKEDYETLVNNAVSVNMNMLRVWGGAAYENDAFYNLCNAEGIMVWQDFMFACNMYPSDNIFVESVIQELDYNIKRLRNHPSVVLWCGNNEILEGFHLWGWKEQLGIHSREAFKSYERLFYQIIPEILSGLDGLRPYLPSSPSSSFFEAPGLGSGDYHYWEIIKKPLPLSAYAENTGRFMSEFGFKSYPDIKTIRSYAEEKDFDINSEVLEFHQGWESGAEMVDRHVNDLFGKARDFEHFLYLSQLTQKHAIKIAIEAHRRAKPRCMGSLLWQLNDSWPCASWSATDYFGRWKALMYELKHLFATNMISPVINKNELEVYVISDHPQQLSLNASIKLIDFDGVEIFKKELEVLSDGKSQKIFSIPLDKMNIADRKTRVVLVTELFAGDKKQDRNLFYFVNPSELLLKPASPKIEFSDTGNKTMIFLHSDTLVKNIFIENLDAGGFFSDNFFDLLPGENKSVIFQPDANILPDSKFAIKCLNNIKVTATPAG